MTLIKNRSTKENQEFWDHVEKVANEVRSRRADKKFFKLEFDWQPKDITKIPPAKPGQGAKI